MHVFLAAADWGKAKERENKQGTGLWINLMQDPFSVSAFAKLTQYRVPQAETFKLLGDKDTQNSENNVKYYFSTTPQTYSNKLNSR
jgi:hypothetical protein